MSLNKQKKENTYCFKPFAEVHIFFDKDICKKQTLFYLKHKVQKYMQEVEVIHIRI